MDYKILEKHISPDKLLTFSVLEYEDGDTSLGFDNYEWHTHGGILASTSGLTEEKAIRQFVNNLLNNNKLLVVMKKEEEIVKVWITEDPTDELKYQQDDEVLEFRYWNRQNYIFEK